MIRISRFCSHVIATVVSAPASPPQQKVFFVPFGRLLSRVFNSFTPLALVLFDLLLFGLDRQKYLARLGVIRTAGIWSLCVHAPGAGVCLV